ncbi:MAG: GNAT family N-acetyltransferase [Thaumarchaeota archaeon]|nr:GNAT family N-acetyltransferase [Nitrososphaerota archaeon]
MAERERRPILSGLKINAVDPASEDAQWCINQYFFELNRRFKTGFNPANSIPADTTELTPPAGILLIAYLKEDRVGCGALKYHEDKVGELKRMWVAPQARGLGIGRSLLCELESTARQAGMMILHLETNESLVEAISLYRKSGYEEVKAFNDDPYAHHWFEKRL